MEAVPHPQAWDKSISQSLHVSMDGSLHSREQAAQASLYHVPYPLWTHPSQALSFWSKPEALSKFQTPF